MEVGPLPDGFRVALPDDAERITRYHHAAWLARLQHLFSPGALLDADPVAKLERWHGWLAEDSGITTVVAERSGMAVGHTTVRDDELIHLFIDPSWQGTGFGGQLLDIGEDLVRQAGYRSIWLQTLVGNRAAVDFYLARGWQLTDERTAGTYFGHVRTEHTLIKDLG